MPGQVPAIGVITYVIVPADVPELRIPASEILPVPVRSNPVIVPDDAEAVHEKVAPATFEVGANDAVPLLQIVWVSDVLVIVAFG